jgi:hypothetical protein
VLGSRSVGGTASASVALRTIDVNGRDVNSRPQNPSRGRTECAMPGRHPEHRIQVDLCQRVTARKAEEDVDWYSERSQGVYEIRDFIEFKTTWHPIGV